MATRPELVEICKELELDYRDLTIEEMKKLIRKEVNKKFKSRKLHFSADKLSKTLLKFMTLEHDFVILDKEGNLLDYKGNIIKRRVK